MIKGGGGVQCRQGPVIGSRDNSLHREVCVHDKLYQLEQFETAVQGWMDCV